MRERERKEEEKLATTFRPNNNNRLFKKFFFLLNVHVEKSEGIEPATMYTLRQKVRLWAIYSRSLILVIQVLSFVHYGQL